ncbi:hypothetical protein D6856_04570 [Butyrivibrio sp. XB500-5]|uniref:DUF6056 family protein n=1 Tax=Butyrivibrio sp. XB500-5 TaxID=2364880 RepID=UPI000EA85563|nr:hypothetical protein [Butyrivibrio sp. XB500-5]RKM63402.1 hypothetical protein D6856_04570 [Butyrivibrio sp. XB500-5]
MLDYKLPFLKKKISYKTLSIVMICIFALSLIPLLIMGFYDFPSADDFSMAREPHLYFAATGNFFGAIVEAFKKAIWIYYNYEGYYFSALLTCLCPAVFGEQFYFLVPFIIIAMLVFGVCYFFNALFVRAWKFDKHLSNVVSMATLIMMIHFLKDSKARNQGFYWWSGAVNYVFTFGMAFFWVGLLIRILYDENKKACMGKFIWACIWGFPLGGANYLTALELAIVSVLVIFICVMNKFSKIGVEGLGEIGEKYIKLLWIPALINLIGFGFSVTAPGIKIRTADTVSNSPVKAVLLSLYGTFNVIIDEMARWETLVVLLFLVPIFWVLAGKLKNKLRHPFVFALFAYGMVSSNLTPPYYAVSNFDEGRLVVLAWMEFVFFAVMTVFYLTAWIRGLWEDKAGAAFTVSDNDSFSGEASSVILVLAAILVYGSALCVVPNPHYYTATSALYEITTGNAARYKEENNERLKVLKDTSVETAVLKEYTDAPDMLFYKDITDPEFADYWINTNMATWYNKKDVVIERIKHEE